MDATESETKGLTIAAARQDRRLPVLHLRGWDLDETFLVGPRSRSAKPMPLLDQPNHGKRRAA